MASSKSVVKGLAAGALLAAVGAMIMRSRDKKAKDIGEVAGAISERVVEKARQLGAVSKGAYGKIVDALISEYKGAKTLSETELKELKEELKESWRDVENILRTDKVKKAVKKATKK